MIVRTVAALRGLLAGCPLELRVEEAFGVDRDGERIALGPKGRGALADGDEVIVRVWHDGRETRVAWQFLSARPGVECRIGPCEGSRLRRWARRRGGEGPVGHAGFDAQFEVRGVAAARGVVDAALAAMLAAPGDGCSLVQADLVQVIVRPGSNLVVTCRVDERPDAVAASLRLALAIRGRLVPA